MKVAIYESDLTRSGHKYTSVSEALDWMEESKDWVRISEIVEVEIPLLKETELIKYRLAVLDNQETELRNRFQDKLNNIEYERGKLLSLTHSE